MNINGQTKVLGVIGNPIEHTLSPLIHNEIMKAFSENAVYVPFHVKNHIEEALIGAHGLGVKGVNVTIPYKLDALKNACELDDYARLIGAVNTLVYQEDGYKGYNTDLPGLKRAFDQEGIELAGQKVIILGAGGVARAVALLFYTLGVDEIYIMNRTKTKASVIADEVNVIAKTTLVKVLEYGEYKKLSDAKYICVQATSVGMKPDIDRAFIEEKEFYKKIHIAYDLVYNPSETKFMKLSKEAGARAYNGLYMLLYQAVIAYELWFGYKVEQSVIEPIYELMKEELANR